MYHFLFSSLFLVFRASDEVLEFKLNESHQCGPVLVLLFPLFSKMEEMQLFGGAFGLLRSRKVIPEGEAQLAIKM